MNRDQARQEVNRRNVLDLLSSCGVHMERSKNAGKNMFCCPVCGSGTGAKHTGALQYYPESNRLCCHKGSCELGGKGQDALGSLRIILRCSESEVFEMLGVHIDGGKISTTAHAQSATQKAEKSDKATSTTTTPESEPERHTAYYEICRENLRNSQKAISYLSARGIRLETALRFCIGFDEYADPAGKGYKEPRIIIPANEHFYFTRAINPDAQIPKMNCKTSPGVFKIANIGILHNPNAPAIFVCESWGSALSIAEAGCNVLWMNSTKNADQLLDHLKKEKTDSVLCLCLDNDAEGIATTEKIQTALHEIGVKCVDVTGDICEAGCDPNDELVTDRAAFIAKVKAAEQKALYPSLQAFDSFMMKIQTESYRPIPTGMQSLDNLLGGGIMRQGLIILMAAPGAGKTCFAQQVFEGMAKGGADVIFLNLEMSREQLYARGLSRIIWKNRRKLSATDVMRGYEWTPAQRDIVQEAAEEYRSTIAPRMSYNPDGCTTSIESIMKTLDAAGEKAKRQGKAAPVVVLDYLHLVTAEKRMEQAEIIKQTVYLLKEWAIRYDSFVFAISASNRTSNSSGTQNLESGRDSSAIEYTADTALGLNYTAFVRKKQKPNGKTYSASDPDDQEELMNGNANGEREMTVQVLKNRMTKPGGKLDMLFNPASSTFTPIDKGNHQQQTTSGMRRQHEQDEDNPLI